MTSPFGDAEDFLIQQLTDVLAGVHVCLELPPAAEFEQRLPILQLTRAGGPSTTPTWGTGHLLDEPTISVDVFAASRQAANETTAAVRAAFDALAGARNDGLAVISVRELTGPGWRPDASEHITRIGLNIAVLIRPI